MVSRRAAEDEIERLLAQAELQLLPDTRCRSCLFVTDQTRSWLRFCASTKVKPKEVPPRVFRIIEGQQPVGMASRTWTYKIAQLVHIDEIVSGDSTLYLPHEPETGYISLTTDQTAFPGFRALLTFPCTFLTHQVGVYCLDSEGRQALDHLLPSPLAMWYAAQIACAYLALTKAD